MQIDDEYRVNCEQMVYKHAEMTVKNMCKSTSAVLSSYCREFECYCLQGTALRYSPHYVKYYLIYFNFLIHGLIPFIFLLVINTIICRRVSSLC